MVERGNQNGKDKASQPKSGENGQEGYLGSELTQRRIDRPSSDGIDLNPNFIRRLRVTSTAAVILRVRGVGLVVGEVLQLLVGRVELAFG